MSDDKKAFPSTTPDSTHWESGMSLRDYFAGQAMLGKLGHGEYPGLAKAAYDFADAMMKARQQ